MTTSTESPSKKAPSDVWNIWIDTGGTFTDCIAIDPDGQVHRAKVLSSGVLPARIDAHIAPDQIRLKRTWSWSPALLTGYKIRDNEGRETRIKEFAEDGGICTLAQSVSWQAGTQVDITGEEEAPVLVSRLITNTGIDAPLPVIHMRLGTTKATNALLERKGGKIAFVTTAGLEDIVEIGTQQRPDLFALRINKPVPLYTQVFGFPGRTDPKGEVSESVDQKEVTDLAASIVQGDFDAVAVSLLNAYTNAVHEKGLVRALHNHGVQHISSGSALYSGPGLLARSQTAIVNAYLQPVLEAYLDDITGALDKGRLHVISSAGGAVARKFYTPKDALLSGPAAGVVAARHLGEETGLKGIITFDMGGTSTDCARIDGGYTLTDTMQIGSIQLLSPAIDIETVASGGGSICALRHGKLVVGPDSAGAFPGPACYGNGGPLAITDVNLLLGRINPGAMDIPISIEAAKEALHAISRELSEEQQPMSDAEILTGFEQIANETMAAAVRKISVEKGYDPADYHLLSYGGAGGLHACGIADILGIDTVIWPYDAGLFSARGVGAAPVSREVQRHFSEPLEKVTNQLAGIFDKADQDAGQLLQEEGLSHVDPAYDRTLYLRFQGQHYEIGISWDRSVRPAKKFFDAYKKVFGYCDEEQSIEISRVRVIASIPPDTPDLHTQQTAASNGPRKLKSMVPDADDVAVHSWQAGQRGESIDGPALITNPYATYYVAQGWQVKFENGDVCYCRRMTPRDSDIFVSGKQALDLELFTRRFTAIAEQMGAQLQRTAKSVNVKQRLDYSCAILDPDGHLLTNAAHIPVHLGSMGIYGRSVIKRLLVRPGDIVISNHPAYGGSHLPDVSLLAGAFDDQGHLIGYVVNRAHHAEIGGKTPGSMPVDATTLTEEGVVLEPQYLFENGEPRWDNLRQLLSSGPYPSRAVDDNIADIRAAVAALQTGIRGLKSLASATSLATVKHYMQALQEYSGRVSRQAIRTLDEGRYEASEYLDDGSTIKSVVQVTGDALHLDFTGSSTVHAGNLNATEAIIYSAVLYVIRLLIAEPLPLNEGILQHVEVVLPNSFLNPDFADNPEHCPAVVGGNTETSQRLVDTLIKALGMGACGQGTMNNLVFGNDRFGYYETIGGGAGAGDGYHGASAVHQHMTNTRITDPEEIEKNYPVRLRKFAIRKGSGGAGAYRGGDGIVREIEFLEAVDLSFLSQHRLQQPFGAQGGSPGAQGKQWVVRTGDAREELEGVCGVRIYPGDRFIVKTPGGGGYGDPKDVDGEESGQTNNPD